MVKANIIKRVYRRLSRYVNHKELPLGFQSDKPKMKAVLDALVDHAIGFDLRSQLPYGEEKNNIHPGHLHLLMSAVYAEIAEENKDSIASYEEYLKNPSPPVGGGGASM